MLGGSDYKMNGGKKVKRSGCADCNRMQGGKRKPAKKAAKKAAKKGKSKKGGGFCIGNLAEFESAFGDSSGASSTTAPAPAAVVVAGAAPAPTPVLEPPMTGEMVGGAKKRKSRKAGPYAKFVKKHYASVQKKNPKFKATDCMKEIAKMWRAQKK